MNTKMYSGRLNMILETISLLSLVFSITLLVKYYDILFPQMPNNMLTTSNKEVLVKKNTLIIIPFLIIGIYLLLTITMKITLSDNWDKRFTSRNILYDGFKAPGIILLCLKAEILWTLAILFFNSLTSSIKKNSLLYFFPIVMLIIILLTFIYLIFKLVKK